VLSERRRLWIGWHRNADKAPPAIVEYLIILILMVIVALFVFLATVSVEYSLGSRPTTLGHEVSSLHFLGLLTIGQSTRAGAHRPGGRPKVITIILAGLRVLLQPQSRIMTRGSEVPRSTGCEMISSTSNELHYQGVALPSSLQY